jgi:hypothetical protein
MVGELPGDDALITHEQISDFYDWLSRYVQLSNWLSYRDRFAAFTMHKRLCVPTQAGGAGGRTAGLEYVNDRLLEVAGLPPEPRVLDAGCGFGARSSTGSRTRRSSGTSMRSSPSSR